MGIEVLLDMFRDTGTPEQRQAAEKARKKSHRLFLAKAFVAVAGTVSLIGGTGYWLGSHHTQSSHNNCTTTAPPSNSR